MHALSALVAPGEEHDAPLSVSSVQAHQGSATDTNEDATVEPLHAYAGNKKLAKRAHEPGQSEIWSDVGTLHFLRGGTVSALDASSKRARRVLQRAARYRYSESVETGAVLERVMANGTTRVVPHPRDRIDIINRCHSTSGHFGIIRTAHLLLQAYWWQGIMKDVGKVVGSCLVCGEAKAQFNRPTATLNPLPLMGLMYRWHLDLMGPFPTTEGGSKYVMIMIEAGSKLLVLEPIPAKEPKYTTWAFEHGVLARFGSCAKIVTDQGSEWMGVFSAMTARTFIDHRHTSASRPQSNGAAERCVKFAKECVRKHCVDTRTINTWDKALPYICLGYNCSKQKSTNCSPFELLYARSPTFPSSVHARMQPVITIPEDETPEVLAQHAVRSITERSAWLREALPVVANNLAIAQHRDKLRYAMTRGGTYLPKLVKFAPGDFVYIRRNEKNHTLQIVARQYILRVLRVKESGVLVLQGRCGNTYEVNQEAAAPCHVPFLDGTIDPSLAIASVDLACEVCNLPDPEALILMCDSCGTGWHTFCLKPPLEDVPEGLFICPNCTRAGVTEDQLRQRAAILSNQPPPREVLENLFKPRVTRVRDEAAKMMDGRIVGRKQGTKAGNLTQQWGVVSYRGAE